MRRIFGSLLLAAALLVILPVPAAQAQDEDPGYVMIMVVDMSPSDRAAYSDAVTNLAEAAAEQGVQSSWTLWSRPAGYTVVIPIPNMAWLDDDGAFWGQFDESARTDFQSAMSSVSRQVNTEVIQPVPEWGYTPSTPAPEMNIAHVHHDYLNPGMDEAYDELSKDWVTFLASIDYPYGSSCSRTKIGSAKITCVTWADNMSRFTSDETWDDLLEAAGAEDEFEQLLDRWRGMVDHWNHFTVNFQKDMSYWPGKTD
jgi:hypothetical protein